MARILFVDDNRRLLELYAQEFSDDGYDVRVAHNGQEALEAVKSSRPDLVVVDIRMPGMDGIELVNRILSRDRRMPVIIHTAYSLYKDNFMTWCADAYVVKSGDLTELKQTVARILTEHGGQDDERLVVNSPLWNRSVCS
ncbi:MAG: response regulator [Planctomycetota bacterium]|nr:response regulator [Planctomycetota bacterium]